MSKNTIRQGDLPVDKSFEYGTRRPVPDFFNMDGHNSFTFITFEPGEGGPLHYHEPPKEEIYYILKGKLDVRMGDEVVEADQGTVLYTPPEMKHQPMNNYDDVAVLLTVHGPGTDPHSVRVRDEWSPPE